MTENSVPKLNRSVRDSDTRETTTRRKPWAPPSRLDAPPAPAGSSTVGSGLNQAG